MLHKPDVHTAKLLDLADFIEGLAPDKFSMGSWGEWDEPRCICGWLMQCEGHIDKTDERLGADILGLSYEVAHDLFTYLIPPPRSGPWKG